MQVSAENLGEQWPILIQHIKNQCDNIIITEGGKAIATLSAFNGKDFKKSRFGCMKGTVRITGDIIGPIGEEWDVER